MFSKCDGYHVNDLSLKCVLIYKYLVINHSFEMLNVIRRAPIDILQAQWHFELMFLRSRLTNICGLAAKAAIVAIIIWTVFYQTN